MEEGGRQHRAVGPADGGVDPPGDAHGVAAVRTRQAPPDGELGRGQDAGDPGRVDGPGPARAQRAEEAAGEVPGSGGRGRSQRFEAQAMQRRAAGMASRRASPMGFPQTSQIP